MVIFSTQNYTTQTTTPILDAKLGEHYARLMHLSLIWLSPLIFVQKMILKVIETYGSMCRRLQFYHYVSSSQLYFCLWYCLFKNNWQLISIDSLSPFNQTCPALGRQDLLLSRSWTKLQGEISHYVSWLADLDTVKTNFLPAFRNVSAENVRPIVFVINYGHIYLGRMVRYLLFVLSAYFAYIFFLLNFNC